MFADEFSLFLEQRTNALHSGRHDDPTLFDYVTIAPPEEKETHGVAMPQNTLFATLRAAYDDHSWLDHERLQIRSGALRFDIEVRDFEDRFELQFKDGSVFVARPSVETRRAPKPEGSGDSRGSALDEGAALLEPITEMELRGTEDVLEVLLAACEAKGLTRVQRDRIIAMAGLIGAERNATRPDSSSRWRLVGPVRSALMYLANEPPSDALGWQNLVDVLASIDWHTVAQDLPRCTSD